MTESFFNAEYETYPITYQINLSQDLVVALPRSPRLFHRLLRRFCDGGLGYLAHMLPSSHGASPGLRIPTKSGYSRNCAADWDGLQRRNLGLPSGGLRLPWTAPRV